MRETLPTDLAAEVERLRKQVLDLGEQVAALTASHGHMSAKISGMEEVMRRALAAAGMSLLPEPQVAAPGARRRGHLTSLPGGAR